MRTQTLAQRRAEIERLQGEYRGLSGLNCGVIRGAVDTTDIGARIVELQADYNRVAKKTKYYGGRLVSA